MAGEIFISYRRSDEAKARLLHTLLQQRGVDAWYDALVSAGDDWRTATANALVKAPIFVLLFSRSASKSDEMMKELAAATFQKKIVIPVRLENIAPDGAFLYELASRNWFDAFDDTDARLAFLADRLAALVKEGPDAKVAARALGTTLPTPGRASRSKFWWGVIPPAVVALIAIVAVAFDRIKPPAVPEQRVALQPPRIAFFGFTAIGDDPIVARVAESATDETFRGFSVRQMETAARGETTGPQQKARLERARELGAEFALSGEARPNRDRVAISMRLEDVATRTSAWEGSFEGSAAAPLTVAVQAAAQAIETTYCLVSTGYPSGLDLRAAGLMTARAAVCDQYVRGDLNYLPSALRFWRDTVRVAPDNFRAQGALAAMASFNVVLVSPSARPALLAEADAALARVIALAPESFDAVNARFAVAMTRNAPPEAAAAELERSLRRAPGPGEAVLYTWANKSYGLFLVAMGRTLDALPYLQTAAEGDSFSPFKNNTYALTLALAGKPGAAQRFAQMFVRQPTEYGWEYWLAAAHFFGIGDAGAMLASPPELVRKTAVDCWRDMRAALESTKAGARRKGIDRTGECLAAGNIDPIFAMAVLSSLGDLDGAFAVLDRPDALQFQIFDNTSTMFWPATRAMRADPRFLPLVEKLGYVEYWKKTGTRPDVCASEKTPLCDRLTFR